MGYQFILLVNTTDLNRELGFAPHLENVDTITHELKIRAAIPQDATLESATINRLETKLLYAIER